MPAIWKSHENGRWSLLSPSEFPAEAVLHDLVEQAPQMLPLAGSPRLTVLGREVRLGNGYADLIAVESPGRLAIIEVKLAGNSESRRAVVAQALSYAAYLQGLDPHQLESQVLSSHLGKRGCRTVLDAVEADDQEHALDAQAFSDGVADSLAQGNFRLVIVLDDAPDELVQLIGYLQSVTSKIVIDLIAVTAYQVNGQQIVVPHRVEPAPRTEKLSDAEALDRQAGVLRPGSHDFRTIIADASPSQRELLLRLTDWAEQLAHDDLTALFTYQGKARTTLLPRLDGKRGLVTIYKDTKSSYLQLWRSTFEQYAPDSIPLVESLLGASIGQGSTVHDVTDELLEALSQAYREAAVRPPVPDK